MSHSGRTRESSFFGVAYEKKTGQSFLPAAPNKFFSNMILVIPARENRPLPTFATVFSAKKQACGPEARALRAESIGSVILDFGLRISDFLAFFLQSAFRNRHSAI
jgi:hypothetical protein